MRFTICCFAVLLSLPLFAPSSAKAADPEVTAEGYRDLILNRSDVVNMTQSLFGGPTAGCVNTVDTEKAKVAAQSSADHQNAWARVRVPKALEASHAEILSWLKSAESVLRTVPACHKGMLQASMEQLSFFMVFGRYDVEVRKNAASALTGMGVTLPPAKK